MRKYEVLFIVHPDRDDEQIASIIARYTDVITAERGTIITAEKWAKRRLAYEIDDLREGIYIIIEFEGPSTLSEELDRMMKLDQGILRHMISRIDHAASAKAKPRKPRSRAQEPGTDRGPRVRAPRAEAGHSDETSPTSSQEN